MVHDFAITENYAIVPDLPFEIKAIDGLFFGKPFFQLDVTKPCRYGLLPRKAKSQRDVIWFDFKQADGHFAFHYANAYETRQDDEEIVVLYAAALKKFDCFFYLQEEHPFYKTKDELQTLHEIRLNVTTGEYSIEELVLKQGVDLLMINPGYVGNETNRYIYCATLGNETISKKARESYWFNGFYKYDTELRRIVKQVKYDRESHGGEVQFVPRKNASAEDDGYLMTYVYDPTDDTTDFCIWDA